MPEWHPLFLLTTIGILLGAIFLFTTWYVFCLERLVWFESLLVSLPQSSLLYTPFERAIHDLLELLSMLHLNLYELWNFSSASLISFWARCALLFLKKCSHASLRFIWDLVFFLINSLLLHLDYFERKKYYAHVLHLNLFELIKSNIWKLVPKW